MGKSQVTIYLKGRGEINIDGRGHCESNSPGLSYEKKETGNYQQLPAKSMKKKKIV